MKLQFGNDQHIAIAKAGGLRARIAATLTETPWQEQPYYFSLALSMACNHCTGNGWLVFAGGEIICAICHRAHEIQLERLGLTDLERMRRMLIEAGYWAGGG